MTPPKVMTPSEKRLSFLDLPPELRNQIYALTIPTNQTLDLRTTTRPPLSLTCQKIYSETIPIHLSTNTFTSYARHEIMLFLQRLSDHHLSFLKDVRLNLALDLSWMRCLRDNLRFLEDRCARGCLGKGVLKASMRTKSKAVRIHERVRAEMVLVLQWMTREELEKMVEKDRGRTWPSDKEVIVMRSEREVWGCRK